jgi:hypothetical protein
MWEWKGVGVGKFTEVGRKVQIIIYNSKFMEQQRHRFSSRYEITSLCLRKGKRRELSWNSSDRALQKLLEDAGFPHQLQVKPGNFAEQLMRRKLHVL